jgi:outer membrane protease
VPAPAIARILKKLEVIRSETARLVGGSVVFRAATVIFGAGLVAIAGAGPAAAADQTFPPPSSQPWIYTVPDAPALIYEVGARYWYGWGKTAKDLYAPGGSLMVSRLTYSDVRTHAGEGYARVDHTYGWFLKGYVGAGVIGGGTLTDEDFPPLTVPYSSTKSEQNDGALVYASVDAGFSVLKGGNWRLGAFVGYHYLQEKVSAFGCSQVGSHPLICVPDIPSAFVVINQNNTWHSLRIGVEGDVKFGHRVKLNMEAAWLPYVMLDGADTHWLRIGSTAGDFSGPVPEDGKGWGYQLEAVLSYQLTNHVSLGVGGRYWHMETSGDTHFENHVVGFSASPQPVKWKTDHYGIFLQGSLKFGPYPAGLN